MNKSEALVLLQKSIGKENVYFRDGQWEAIDALVNERKKVLVVQRTGWGKSSVYFISTKILRDRGRGPTIIISPLLALMRNQIESAARLGVRAETINSSNRSEWQEKFWDLKNDAIDALLISPERLANEEFIHTLLEPVLEKIGLLVIDEAHCISDWGHDFRPDFQRITEILQRMPPNIPVLATTATANNRVIEDIRNQLGDVDLNRGNLDRESLMLQTIYLRDKASRLAWLAAHISEMKGTGIIYTLTVSDAENVTAWLRKNGIEAKAYHSKVTAQGNNSKEDSRIDLENQLLENRIKVLVSTVALGMGYDKPDLAFVIHYQTPGSIIHYYQQVGRAGRALYEAYGILLYGEGDEEIHEYFRRTAFPSEDHVNKILSLLSDNEGMSVKEIQTHVNLKKNQIEKVLKYLSVQNPSPVHESNRKWHRSAVHYSLDQEKISRIIEQREEEWKEVVEYCESTQCLMASLRAKLNDPKTNTCDRCSNCRGEPLFPESVNDVLVAEARKFLKNDYLDFTPRKQIPDKALRVYNFGRSFPAYLQPEKGFILSRWNDSGWGTMVADDKHTGYFRDELVDAITGLLRANSDICSSLQWVTCVPSHNHPRLVPDFAERVALKLQIPFIDAIKKDRNNEMQKLQENSFYQCSNLDGVFSIEKGIPSGGVLLIDDIVDSRWTMTILSALLRQNGSGPVYPAALSSTGFGE